MQVAKSSSDDEVDISVFVSIVEDSDSEEGDWRGVTRRDKYGFELEEDLHSDSFIRNASRSSVHEEESQRYWKKYFQHGKSEHKLSRTKIRNIVHKHGVPAEYRSEVWWMLGEIETQENYSPDTFQRLVSLQREQNTNIFQDQIECDLRRTFPGHALFDTKEGLNKLRRVLLAYSSYNPSVGYCQSMNFICALLLLVFDEEKAFWMLMHLIENLLPKDFYAVQMIGTVLDQRVFEHLIAKRLSRIHLHCADIIHPISVATSQWFLCLFVGVLSAEITFRIWDLLFVDGFQVIFQVSLALLKINEESILSSTEETDFFLTLKDIPKRQVDARSLISTMLTRYADIDNKRITKLRNRYRAEVKEKIENKVRQREAAAARRLEREQKRLQESELEETKKETLDSIPADINDVTDNLAVDTNSPGPITVTDTATVSPVADVPVRSSLWPLRQGTSSNRESPIRIGNRKSMKRENAATCATVESS